jgi:anti-sigma B factor antagonist
MLSRSEKTAPPPPHPRVFDVHQRELDGGVVLIAVEGELDLSTAPHLKWKVVDALQTGTGDLVLDLSPATFMDSTTLGMLVGVKRRLRDGERLSIVCPPGDVLKIFEFAGMDEAFAIFPTLAEALADLRGRRAAPPS